MNKEYMYLNGSIIVVDDKKGLLEPIKYFDDFEKALVKENLVETIEKELTKKSQEHQEIRDISWSTILGIGVTLSATAAGFLFKLGIAPSFVETGAVQSAVFATNVGSAMGLLAAITGACTFARVAIEAKSYCRKKGLEKEIEYLANQYELESYKTLSYDRGTKEYENEYAKDNGLAKLVHDKDDLNELNKKLSIMHRIGSEQKRYVSLYQQGLLKEYLKSSFEPDEYSEEELDFIEEHVKEMYHNMPNYLYEKMQEVKVDPNMEVTYEVTPIIGAIEVYQKKLLKQRNKKK